MYAHSPIPPNSHTFICIRSYSFVCRYLYKSKYLCMYAFWEVISVLLNVVALGVAEPMNRLASLRCLWNHPFQLFSDFDLHLASNYIPISISKITKKRSQGFRETAEPRYLGIKVQLYLTFRTGWDWLQMPVRLWKKACSFENQKRVGH
jgi:hypothetical protein